MLRLIMPVLYMVGFVIGYVVLPFFWAVVWLLYPFWACCGIAPRWTLPVSFGTGMRHCTALYW